MPDPPDLSRDNREIELKITGAPAALTRLRRSRMLARLVGDSGRGAWERLVSTYYDTPENDIADSGLALRLREEGGRRIQTVKGTSGADSVIERAETERTLGPTEPFPAAAGDADLDAWISAWRARLRPIARTCTDRWTAKIRRKQALIECAFDFGRVEGRNSDGVMRAAPLAEAELELLDGPPKALFEVARLFLRKPGIRLGAETKLDAARRTGAGGLPGLTPEPRLAFDPDGVAEDALAAAIMAGAERIAILAPAILDARHPEGVHQMRVALRRFRAVERIFRSAANHKRLRRLARRARGFARALSPARDWDVFLDEILPPLKARDYEPDGFAMLQSSAESLRAEAWEQAIETVGGREFTAFNLDLLEAGYLRSWRKSAGKILHSDVRLFAAAALDDRLAAARAAALRIDAPTPAARHPLRIALKKLRYAAQVFRPLYAKPRRKPYMAAMSRLQDAFGALSDAVAAEARAEEAARCRGKAAMRAAGFICGYRAAEMETVVAEADEAWAAFDAMVPFWRENN